MTEKREEYLLELYKKGYNYQDIKSICNQDYPLLTTQDIKRVIKEDKDRIRMKRRKERMPKLDKQTAVKDILLSGLTLGEWLLQEPQGRSWIRSGIEERFEMLKILAKHAGKKHDGTWRVDDSFLEVLNVASTSGIMAEEKSYQYLKKELKTKNVDLIKIRNFEHREDIYTYLLGRFVEEGNYIMNLYDQKLYDQYINKLEKKIDKYNEIAQKLEQKKRSKEMIKEAREKIEPSRREFQQDAGRE